MKPHKIGWLNVPGYIPQTWNPIIGCSKVSEGCRNCYAEKMAYRLWCMDSPGYCHTIDRTGSFGWNGTTHFMKFVLEKPLHWKQPRAIFVNSMGDLFHENTPDEWIDRVFSVMALCPQHLFIVLTKRAERMEKYLRDNGTSIRQHRIVIDVSGFQEGRLLSFPLKNVWLGVTAENQAAADERIPHLLNTPAAVRFVSCEPLLGPIEFFYGWTWGKSRNKDKSLSDTSRIDWIIAGGESGSNQEVRPGHAEWFISLRDLAMDTRVPFFFKQWGNPAAYAFSGFKRQCEAGLDKTKRTGGDILTGKQYHRWPRVNKSDV